MLSVCVCVALVIQQAVRVRHIVMLPVRLYHIFHIISQKARFLEKNY